MILRLSISARQALARLTLPVLIVASFGLLLLGKADALLADRMRMAVSDRLAPIYVAVSGPLHRAIGAWTDAGDLIDLQAENARLRDENERLRQWQGVALALDAENRKLKADLNWIPDAAPSYVTSRVVADAGGIYARAVLLSVGPGHGITKGEIALDERGLVGRVTETGARTARVLLITDLNSRIPVTLEGSRARAIMVGTNGPRPHLLFWPEGTPPVEGERVVTSAEAGAFPANLPVGTVHYAVNNAVSVEPLANLDRLEIVRVFDYGLREPEARPADSHAAVERRAAIP